MLSQMAEFARKAGVDVDLARHSRVFLLGGSRIAGTDVRPRRSQELKSEMAELFGDGRSVVSAMVSDNYL